MNARNYLLITLIGILLFVPFLGHVHLFDWDEVNFAESAREMLRTGDYGRVRINYQPFWEKPPLFIWLQAISMSLFGVNEFAARLPNAITGIVTLLVIYHIGSTQYSKRFGWLWVLSYIGSFLPHFYFKSGIIDPLFNLFIFLGIYQFARLTNLQRYTEGKKLQIAALAGLFIGLAILTKGPVAMLVCLFCLFVFWAVAGFQAFMSYRNLIVFFLVAGLVSCAWFGIETVKNGPWFIKTFIEYQIRLLTTQDAGHGGPFYYHFIVLLLGCFPCSLLIFRSFRTDLSDPYELRNVRNWMNILLFAVLLIVSIVKTKIVHYSSLAYFPLTFLAAYTMYRMLYLPSGKIRFFNFLPLVLLGLIIGMVLAAIPYFANNTALLEPYIKDQFGKAALHANVHWDWAISLIGIFYILAIMVAFYLLVNTRLRKFGFYTLFISTAIVIQCTLVLVVPKIEGYSQGAAIEFFEHRNDGNSYVDVIGYKSYAQFFYTNKALPRDTNMLKLDTLLHGKTDKPVYFVSKIQEKDRIQRESPQLRFIGEKNGFIFFRRIPKDSMVVHKPKKIKAAPAH